MLEEKKKDSEIEDEIVSSLERMDEVEIESFKLKIKKSFILYEIR